MYVYIAPLKDKTAFKVGKSGDPVARLATLSKYYDFDYNNVLLVDCGTNDEAYRAESLFHSTCSKQRIIFAYDGGTEFFAYSTYDDIIVVVNTVAKLKAYKITKMPITAILSAKEIVAVDDVGQLINLMAVKVRDKRLGYNITQAELAKICGIGVRTVRYLEASRAVTLDTFVRVLKALDLDYIFSELEVDTPYRERAGRMV